MPLVGLLVCQPRPCQPNRPQVTARQLSANCKLRDHRFPEALEFLRVLGYFYPKAVSDDEG